MDTMIGKAGNVGKDVRSDCYVEFEYRTQGGLQFEINSKVAALYGGDVRTQAYDCLHKLGIKHGTLRMEDSGALPFVMAARIEAAVRKVVETTVEVLPPQSDENRLASARDAMRFSRLYLPGNSPKLFINAGIHKPHGLILDLEDSVAPDRKFEARFLVRNALRSLNFYGAERMVRINQVPAGLDDLDYIVPHHANLLLIPKCEDPSQIHAVNERIESIQKRIGMEWEIWLMPIIESAMGVIKAFDIASAASNIVAMAIGLEDYTADLGTLRTNAGKESFFARSQVVNACRASGIQPIDSVFSDISDMEALESAALESRSLGFDGMGCIHPRQIAMIHKCFGPQEIEIEKAKKIVLAFDEAMAKGLGVVSLGSKMIDPPVVKRALRTIESAVALGLLKKEWKSDTSPA